MNKSNKIRRSVSMSITDEGRIFESSPKIARKRSLFRRRKQNNLGDMAKFKSKLSIDSDWSVLSVDSRSSVSSLHSLRERSLTSIKSGSTALGTKLKKVKLSLSRKLRKVKSKTTITEISPPICQSESPKIQCRTVYNHILAGQQEYVEEYDLVIWEEAYETKNTLGNKLKKLVKWNQII